MPAQTKGPKVTIFANGQIRKKTIKGPKQESTAW
jgi:hypothetical protein